MLKWQRVRNRLGPRCHCATGSPPRSSASSASSGSCRTDRKGARHPRGHGPWVHEIHLADLRGSAFDLQVPGVEGPTTRGLAALDEDAPPGHSSAVRSGLRRTRKIVPARFGLPAPCHSACPLPAEFGHQSTTSETGGVRNRSLVVEAAGLKSRDV